MKAILLTLLLFTAGYVDGEELSPSKYIKIFTGNNIQLQEEASKELAWAGLSDPVIFDLVESLVLKKYQNKLSKQEANHVAWLVKALGFSGNPKYRETLQIIRNDAATSKLKKYAAQAVLSSSDYERWNPIISGGGSAYLSETQRFANMINSREYELIRIAAKRIHFQHLYSDEMLAIVANSIEQNYKKDEGQVFIDTMAWLTKAIAGSKSYKYKPLIEKVAASASNKKLRKYATKYLNYYNN